MTPQDAAHRLASTAIRGAFVAEALHAYTDETGRPIYWRVRARLSDGSKWIRPMRRDGADYVLGEPAFPAGKPIYRLHEIAAKPGSPVWFVEGENCADELAKLGLLATTAGGATSDEHANLRPLAGRTVTIWPDNDAAGLAHAERVVAKLRMLGCTVEMIDARSLGLPEGGDCVDWLRAHPGATAADLARLPRLAPAGAMLSQTDSPRVELVCGADLRPAPIEWLWNGWLAAGKLHVIAGAPEAGKTFIALALAATLTTGGRWPDGTRAMPGDVVIWSGEDAVEDTLVPRLLALGADVKRVRFVRRVADPEGTRPFDPARDMVALQAALGDRRPRLLIVDPVVSVVMGDSHENARVRRALQPVVDLAEAIGCGVIGISHFSKGTAGRDPVERVTGSVAFGALPRLVFAAAKRPEEEGGGRIFVRAKSNIGPSGTGFEYRIEPCTVEPRIGTSRLLWGAALNGTARRLLATVEAVDGTEHRGIAAAMAFLADLLAYGPVPAKQIKKDAEGAGHAWRTVQEAAGRLRVERRKIGMRAGWEWALPTPAVVPPKMHDVPKMHERARLQGLRVHASSGDLAPSSDPEGVRRNALTQGADEEGEVF